jgi:anti-sigma regulatory factor (Ser/Thr protein kinase)
MSLDCQVNSQLWFGALSAANGFSGTSSRDVDLALVSERARIAQELHDTLLQGFFAASMRLHTTLDRLSQDCPEKQQLEGIVQLVDRALEEGRCALQGLQSTHRHAGTLGEAFARVPRDLGLSRETSFRVIVLGAERKLGTDLLDEIYRIGREAIINAFRHSRATDIEVEVEYRTMELRIAVRDNGCGIGSRDLTTEPAGHWGLRGMRERAERIGARLQLWSAEALGTEVELCVPGKVAFKHPSETLLGKSTYAKEANPVAPWAMRAALRGYLVTLWNDVAARWAADGAKALTLVKEAPHGSNISARATEVFREEQEMKYAKRATALEDV